MRKFCITLIMMLSAIILSAGSYPVKPREKVMFFGDSITHAGHYITFLQLMLDSRGVAGTDMMNSGISGGTAASGLRRIQYDVIDRKPDRVFILFGMNDVGRGILYRVDSPANFERRKRGLAAFTANQKKIIRLLKDAGITPVLMTPTAYDQYQKDGKSDRCNEPGLIDFAAAVRKLAKEEGVDVIELHSCMTDILKKYPELRFCGKDLVHPTVAGHWLMASLIAEQTGLTGPVADVTISADGKVQSRFAKITEVKTASDKITFRYTPERMAVALGKNVESAEKVYPFAEKFNREMLKITGLADGNYTLSADGKKLGSFTAVRLARGIDLANLDTPNRKRAENAMKTTLQLYNQNSLLRTLEQCRFVVMNSKFLPENSDPKDFKLISDALQKWLDSHGENWLYRKYYSWQINTYRKNAPKEADFIALREKLRRNLEQETRPISYVITIEKNK